ncbi:hypothetical protein [Methylibium sp.]|jgi:hypothetical protein|uniref:hypothetical protein n=1 Tax=Methylibium sp. TaxID=2067992 RepID=UPI003D0B3A75
MAQAAQILGKVEYREGDGPMIVIRPGPVEVETTDMDAMLSWAEEDTHGAATMPIADFQRYVAAGAIRLER